MPDIEKKKTIPVQMPGRVCKGCPYVSIANLVADDMKKSDYAIKKAIQSYCLNVILHAI
jgi:hypothetical protein